MTQQNAILHWKRGADDAIQSARLLFDGKQYQHTLFMCHLAVEKALKAAWIKRQDTEEPPQTHDLLKLATALNREWEDEQLLQFEILTRFVIDARYAGSRWTEEYGTKEGAEKWLNNAQNLISLLSE